MSSRIDLVALPFPAGQVYDEVIDVRAPCEFAEDHLSGAVNLPVLSDDERALVGTRYQENRFQARRLGAAMVSRNIAAYLETHFSSKPREYRPLLYCWRGGQRSESLATVLSSVGWRVALIDGGYRAYRRYVRQVLETTPESLRFQVVNGLTGSGKTRVLEALERCGAQVLNLEMMASHKGSVFGGDPARPQPRQRRFESLVFDRLSGFCPDRPVFVEAESPRIGQLDIPRALWKRMRQSEVIEITSTLSGRVAFLQADYEAWMNDQARILATIDRLRPFHARKQIEEWRSRCLEGNSAALIQSLLVNHYDRRYAVGYYGAPARAFPLSGHSDTALEQCAAAILQAEAPPGNR